MAAEPSAYLWQSKRNGRQFAVMSDKSTASGYYDVCLGPLFLQPKWVSLTEEDFVGLSTADEAQARHWDAVLKEKNNVKYARS